MPVWDENNALVVKTWEDISGAYASQVSGEVYAVVGKQLRPGNVWENIEIKRLKDNPKVTKITIIEPKTLEETVIFERGK